MARQDVDRVVGSVRRAQALFSEFSQDQVDKVLDAMHAASLPLIEKWARLAHEETGYGTVADKTVKNRFAAEDVYRYIRPMHTVGFISADPGRGLYEVASPVGVVAAVVPSTNPTSTALYKILISLKARNGIVLSPHPTAKACIQAVADALHDAAVSAGAPRGIVGVLPNPSIEDTQALMRHPEVNLILATGGMGLVMAAYSSGKPAYGVGPGNVPAFIERTAVLKKAVRDVVAGKSFDWGTICASEQAVIVDAPLAGQAREEFAAAGGHFVSDREKALLEALVVDKEGRLNPKVVGRSPQAIASMAGFEVPPGVKVLLVPEAGVGRDFPLTLEKLSPILSYFEADGWEAGCLRCIEVLQYGGLGHTLCLHTQDPDVIRQFALRKPVFRIVVNSPGTHGAIGYTTNLPPALTLGCGALGNNITSDNITPLHLMDRKRVAIEARPLEGPTAVPLPPLVKASDGLEDAARRFLAQKLGPAGRGGQAPAAPAREPEPPSDFVSEADVRTALRSGRRIRIHARTLLTPSARELGEQHRIFDRD
ncbi:MAG: aldehyde dehydrogenase family protein [Acidobacteriota bacterium]